MTVYILFYTYITTDGEILQKIYGCYDTLDKAELAKKKAKVTLKDYAEIWIEDFPIQ